MPKRAKRRDKNLRQHIQADKDEIRRAGVTRNDTQIRPSYPSYTNSPELGPESLRSGNVPEEGIHHEVTAPPVSSQYCAIKVVITPKLTWDKYFLRT